MKAWARISTRDISRALCGWSTYGEEPGIRASDSEPHAGLVAGHVPGSVNLPFTNVWDQETGLIKSDDELKKLFAEVKTPAGDAVFPDGKVSGMNNFTASCGSGVTANVVGLAAEVLRSLDESENLDGLGYALYDGSWSEWGSAFLDKGKHPIETGEAGSGKLVMQGPTNMATYYE